MEHFTKIGNSINMDLVWITFSQLSKQLDLFNEIFISVKNKCELDDYL